MTKSQFRIGLTCLSFGVFACEGEPELLDISSTQAALTASENVERALQGVLDAADFLASSTSIAETLSVFGGRSETCESSASSCGLGLDCAPPETVCTPDEVSEEDLEERRQELRENVADVVRELRERILVEQNLEAETSTSATYRLGPDVLCSTDDAPDAPGAAPSEPELDADCVEQVNRLEPRLVLTSPHEGDIDMTLLLGADRHAPLTLSLYRQSLGLRLDLGAGLAIARDLGEDLDGLRELAGVLELRLVKHGERDYSLELNVLEALAAVVDSDGETLSTSLGASSPAWNVRVDGNSNTLSAGIDLAAFRLAGPLGAFADMFESERDRDLPPGTGTLGGFDLGPSPDSSDEPSYTGVLDLFLAGLSGTVRYGADSDVLSLDNLGFGDATSTLKHDGNTLFGLDLNATQGRRVNIEIVPTDDGAQINLTPSFDLRLALAFEHIADQVEDIADALLDDTLHIWFDGAAPTLQVESDQIRVAAGTLHLESEANPDANVQVDEGMCLGGEAEADVDTSAEGSDDTVESDSRLLFSIEAVTCAAADQ